MKTTNLAQALAIDSQLRLPGSAGRLLKQIRDIEQVAPLFRDVGLIKAVKRPSVVISRSPVLRVTHVFAVFWVDLSTHQQLYGQI